jgi:hypothetical protein
MEVPITSGISYSCLTSTVTAGAVGTVTITKNTSASGYTNIHTNTTSQRTSTPVNCQVVISDIIAKGSDKNIIITPYTNEGVKMATGQTVDCRFSGQILEFDITGYQKKIYLKVDYPTNLTSFTAKFSIVNDSGNKYISNVNNDGNGFIVYIPEYNYSAEVENWLVQAIESKRPVGKTVKIKTY